MIATEVVMIVVLFRSKLTEAAVDGYPEMASEMLARAKQMPGFIDFKSFKADDGERLSVIHWQDEATLAAWRNDMRHQVAQKAGREKWYEYYKIEVTRVIRESVFEREQATTV
jgi:heme-degrading monooxygenase HmoA